MSTIQLNKITMKERQYLQLMEYVKNKDTKNIKEEFCYGYELEYILNVMTGLLCSCGIATDLEKYVLAILHKTYSSKDWHAEDTREMHYWANRTQDFYETNYGINWEKEQMALGVISVLLDENGWAEHGSSVSNLWLTDEGEWLYENFISKLVKGYAKHGYITTTEEDFNWLYGID